MIEATVSAEASPLFGLLDHLPNFFIFLPALPSGPEQSPKASWSPCPLLWPGAAIHRATEGVGKEVTLWSAQPKHQWGIRLRGGSLALQRDE